MSDHGAWAIYRSPWLYVALIVAFVISPALAVTSAGLAVALGILALAVHGHPNLRMHLLGTAVGLLLGSLPYLALIWQAYVSNTA